MRSRDHPEAIILEESVCHVRPEDVTCRPWRRIEAHPGLVWIRPEQVAHRTGVGNVHKSVDGSDVVYFLNFGAQTAMHAENHVVDQGCQGQEVEDLSEEAPNAVVAVLLYALVVEPVQSICV